MMNVAADKNLEFSEIEQIIRRADLTLGRERREEKNKARNANAEKDAEKN